MTELDKNIFFQENGIDEKGIELLKKIYQDNNEVFETINPSLLQSQYVNTLTLQQISRIACDKEFQDKFLSLDKDRYDLFLKCSQTAIQHGADWIVSTNALVDNLQKPQFFELVENIRNEKSPNVEALNVILSSDDNYFAISTGAQLNSYTAIKNSVCEKIIANPEDTENLSEGLKNMSSLDRIKFARCQQEYNISLSQAKLICQKYGWGINGSDDEVIDKPTDEFLRGLTTLINSNTQDEVIATRLHSCPVSDNNKTQTYYDIDSNLRRGYAQAYNSSFYIPNEQDMIATEDINGKQVPIYDAGVNFSICSHVVGAFSERNNENQSYKDNWNIAKKQSHVFCTRFISNEALEVAKEDMICLGFTDFDKDQLVASAPWDMASISYNTKFDTIGEMDKQKKMSAFEGSGARFLTPQEQINNTRTDGTETNWDRHNQNGERKQPSYLVYIADSLENSEYKNDSLYKESLKAASQFNIPVIIIDRSKVIENEHRQIDNMIDKYSQSKNPKLLNRIIQRFENNRTTCFHQKNENRYQEEFPLMPKQPKGKFKSLHEISLGLLKINPDHAQELVEALSAQVVKSRNNHQEFCNIIYSIKDKCPNIHIDLDKHLAVRLGITQRPKKAEKVGPYVLKSFYEKQQQEKTKSSQLSHSNSHGKQISLLRGIHTAVKPPYKPQQLNINPQTFKIHQEKKIKS